MVISPWAIYLIRTTVPELARVVLVNHRELPMVDCHASGLVWHTLKSKVLVCFGVLLCVRQYASLPSTVRESYYVLDDLSLQPIISINT